MGLKKVKDFLSRYSNGEYKAGETEKYDKGHGAYEDFKSFCVEKSFKSSNIRWKNDFRSDRPVSSWLKQDGNTICDYMWARFSCSSYDDNCVIAISMEKFPDKNYGLYAKFEIYTNKLKDFDQNHEKKIYERFNKISTREDLKAGDMRYIVYHDDIAEWNEDGTFLMSFDEATDWVENHEDSLKRICPSILIADGGDIDSCSDETLIERTARAIDELSVYYDAYYDGLTAGGPHGSGEKKENGTEKKTMIETSKNVILYGPPGTGKTYTTVFRALDIITGTRYDRNKYQEARDEYKGLLEKGQIKFVTFHQSYGYEEFIEGIRPSTDEHGNIRYDVKDGVFKKFCDDARKGMSDGKDGSKDVPYVFIIDEINRGNISKIFGELITLIEDNKREGEKEAAKALLPYPKNDENGEETEDYFSVPRNVYIIGTMNTADRSITAIDTALRRRFVFEEMMPDSDAIKTADGKPITVEDVDVPKMLKKMNERIEALYDREHQIGHAYFMSLKDRPDIDTLSDIFKKKVIPLLQEYFFDDYEKIGCVLGDNMIWDDNKPGREGEQFIRREKINVSNLFGTKNHPPLSEPCYVYSVNEKTPDKPEAYIKIYAEQPDKKETE